jgi:hypothetical protein
MLGVEFNCTLNRNGCKVPTVPYQVWGSSNTAWVIHASKQPNKGGESVRSLCICSGTPISYDLACVCLCMRV